MNRLLTLDDNGSVQPGLYDKYTEEELKEFTRRLNDQSQGNRGSYSVKSDKKIPTVVTGQIPDLALCHSTTIEYYNGTRYQVTIGDRTGVRTTLKPNTVHTNKWVGSDAHGIFIVRVRRMFKSEAIVDLTDLWHEDGTPLHSMDVEPLNDGMVLHKELRDEDIGGMRGRILVTLEYRFGEREFLDKGGSLYCPELDLVLSTLDPAVVPPHPYNLVGNRQLMFKEDPAMRAMVGFQYRLLIIDNALRYGDRYMFLNGQIHRIKPERSGILRDGAWLFSTPPVKDNHTHPIEATAKWIPLEEMDEALNLYRTYEEAITKGTAEARAERLETEKLDIQLTLNKDKRERIELERKLQEESHARARETAEYTRRLTLLKDQLEIRAQKRKDTMDWLKFIPGVLTGIAGLILALAKTFTAAVPGR